MMVRHKLCDTRSDLNAMLQIGGALIVIAGVCTAAFPNKGASAFADVSSINRLQMCS